MKIIHANYTTWLKNYGPGWIGFVRHRSLISDCIAWFTRHWRHDEEPSVSHVFVVTGPNACCEANFDGVEETGLDQYLRNPRYVTYFRKPRGWTAAMGGRMVVEAWRYRGLGYDFSLIAADAISYSIVGRLINGLTGDALDRFVTRLMSSPREMICDKLAVVVLNAQPELRGRGTLREHAWTNNPQRLFSDEEVFEPEVVMVRGAKA